MNSPFPLKAAFIGPASLGEQGEPVLVSLKSLPREEGYCGIVAKLKNTEQITQDRISHLLESHLEHLLADLASSELTASRFEQLLERLNRDFTNPAYLPQPVSQYFSGLIFAAFGSRLLLSGTAGELTAIFLNKTAERRYAVYELHDQFLGPGQTKLFGAVLDGELKPTNILLLSTPINYSLLTISEAQEILIALPPAGALERIRQYISTREPFAGIVLKSQSVDPLSKKTRQSQIGSNPITSLQELENTRENTAAVLGEKNLALHQSWNNLFNILKKKIFTPGAIGSLQGFRRAISTLIGRLEPTLHRLLTIKRSYQIIIPGVFLLLLTLGSFFFFKSNSPSQTAKEIFQDSAVTIEAKLVSAEASLIYKDNVSALKVLKEAIPLFELIVAGDNAQLETVKTLKTRHTTLINRASGRIEVSLTPLLQSGTTATALTIQASLPFVKLSAGAVHSLNGTTLTATTFTHELTSEAKMLVATDSSLLLLNQNNQLLSLNLGTQTSTPLSLDLSSIGLFSTTLLYNRSLYLLASDGEIYKAKPDGDNFISPTPWITKKSTTLNTAQDFTIDGDIYLLLTGDLLRFSGGQETTWQPQFPSDLLKSPQQIWTDINSRYLYITNNGDNSLVVLEKTTGQVVIQYLAPEFSQAIDLSVDEATKLIFILTPNNLYQFTPSHLIP